ncbi:valine--tRNA ligase [Tumebacillus flagellatus]|uniref:Valine--tRNA ligase n=1 Tax=Tumebacillus flagellatus TaxID=1157490 RepID=A0A074M9S5_9BACL|nr:valine--tRNA ligase [Tumebacillus flagellatus]KEO82702.1 valine--tRNA ligase [Tumebacillus flagellatus]
MTELNIPKVYDPKAVETKLYDWWIANNLFKPNENKEAPKYSIVIPPPNVTGNLHMGHALNLSIQDSLIRRKRMQGYDTLWLPGTDHAGIATQAKVEKKLRDEQGVSRYDLGREKFLEKVWEWKDEYADTIHKQWAKVGISVDYSRERFTLDEGLSKAVRTVFVKLYEKGLIYRGNRIINWDPAQRTALSDIEVIYQDVQGALYHLQYPLTDGSGHITVATTRPETMLGDTAVAVHPEDERYQHLIGKTVTLPIMNREIPIVGDDYVDKEFGSGCVKITPAHDPNDFELGLRHDLPQINVMDESGTMNANAGPYQGLDRADARKKIVKDLQEMGVLIKIEEHMHSVGHSERSGAVVEPFLSTQWFVKMQPLADAAIEAQKNEKTAVNFVPERFERTYLHWIENIRDWCISRQLWWGHRIPAWYCECGETIVSMEEVTSCPKCGSHNLKQDDDVLDTWFSSGLWPFSTMGWPEQTEDLKRYYPTDVLVTAYDIIFFWVARMIFTALEFTEEKPFSDVLIHGLIRDPEGRKMSKSLGNGIDPLEVIEKYGTDAMRFMLLTGLSPGNDMRFNWERVEMGRNFANKIWNASRFVMMNLDESFTYEGIHENSKLGIAEKWILHRLNETAREVNARMDNNYDIGAAGTALYEFLWNEYCDWYIELAKMPLNGEDEAAKNTTKNVLVYVLDQALRLLHPFMPFLTEEIWQHLPASREGESIMTAKYPEYSAGLDDATAEREMSLFIDIIRSIRNTRAELNVPMSRKITLLIKANDAATEEVLKRGESYLVRFCNPESLTIGTDLAAPDKAVTNVVTGAELFLPLQGLIDIDAEIARLEKEAKKLDGEVERIEKKLGNQGFVAKAPAEVIEAEKAKLADYAEKRAKVNARIAELRG